jgi:hypothetical protein
MSDVRRCNFAAATRWISSRLSTSTTPLADGIGSQAARPSVKGDIRAEKVLSGVIHIEITRANDGNTVIVHRTSVDEMNPYRARVKATNLLNLYAGRGADGARVLNDKNEELYKF